MPVSKRRKIRDKSKPVFKKTEEPYSYPVGDWLQNEKGLTAADSEIVRRHEAEGEERLRAYREKFPIQ